MRLSYQDGKFYCTFTDDEYDKIEKHKPLVLDNGVYNLGMMNFIKKLFKAPREHLDEGIENFCKAEYGDDWQWAYISYKHDKKFPNSIRRTL